MRVRPFVPTRVPLSAAWFSPNFRIRSTKRPHRAVRHTLPLEGGACPFAGQCSSVTLLLSARVTLGRPTQFYRVPDITGHVTRMFILFVTVLRVVVYTVCHRVIFHIRVTPELVIYVKPFFAASILFLAFSATFENSKGTGGRSSSATENIGKLRPTQQ